VHSGSGGGGSEHAAEKAKATNANPRKSRRARVGEKGELDFGGNIDKPLEVLEYGILRSESFTDSILKPSDTQI
jgi:hypothetical protein